MTGWMPYVAGKKATPIYSTTTKTLFPCKVMDKNGNTKKIITPEEFAQDSYRWHKHKWVKQPAKQDEQPAVQGLPGTPTAQTTHGL